MTCAPRRAEITTSIRFITDSVQDLGSYGGALPAAPPPAPSGQRSGVGIAEGWRGTIASFNKSFGLSYAGNDL
jgi:hypothetical protein